MFDSEQLPYRYVLYERRVGTRALVNEHEVPVARGASYTPSITRPGCTAKRVGPSGTVLPSAYKRGTDRLGFCVGSEHSHEDSCIDPCKEVFGLVIESVSLCPPDTGGRSITLGAVPFETNKTFEAQRFENGARI